MWSINNHLAKFDGHKHSGNGDIMISVCQEISQDQGVMWLYRQEHIQVVYHPAKFGSHRHSDNGNIAVLVCYVILQNRVIKTSCDFIGRSPNLVIIPLQFHFTFLGAISDLDYWKLFVIWLWRVALFLLLLLLLFSWIARIS